MARGKGKYGPKSKILVVLKSAHHKFLENALSKLIFSKVENGTPYNTYAMAAPLCQGIGKTCPQKTGNGFQTGTRHDQ